MAGPQEEKLRQYLAPARRWTVFLAQEQWRKGADKLRDVALAIEEARPLAQQNLGDSTADAADLAFAKMHEKVKARETQMRNGAKALNDAAQAIGRAEAVRNGFDADGPLSEPKPPDYSTDEIEQIQQMKSHNAQMSAYNSQLAAREEAATAAMKDMDDTNRNSAEVMRGIQGERPDVPTDGGGGNPPRTPTEPPRGTGRPTNPPTNQPTNEPTPIPTNPTEEPTNPPPPPTNPTEEPTNPPTNPPPPPPTGTPTGPNGQPVPVGTSGPIGTSGAVHAPAGNIGGLAGAVGGGLAGGALGMGAIRGGIGGGAAPTGGAGAGRALGSSGRVGSSGALGRGAGAGSGSTTGRGAAGRGAGAGAGARGKGAGKSGGKGAGGAGARGRGAAGKGSGAAGGRGGRKTEDEKKSQVDHLIDDQDWIDDEDAAPGVIH